MEKWKLPEGWKYVQLHDLCAQITDGTHKTPNYKKDGVRFISIQNLRRFAPIDWGAYVRFVSLEEHAYLVKRVRPEKGDVLVTKIGTLGVAKVIDFDEEVSIFVGLALLKPKRELIDGKYLEAVLNSPAYVQLAYEKARGAGRKTLPLVELNKFPIPIPYPDDPVRSLAEQRRIVARLEALLGEVREMRALQAQIEADVGRLMGAVLAEVFGEIERHYPGQRTIEELTDVTSGGTPLRSRSEYYAEGRIPWVKTGELKDDLIIETEEYITDKGLENSSAKLFPVNTLLVAMYGQGQTRGRTGILGIEAATNQACCAILPNPNKFDPFYLQFWFRSMYQTLRRHSESHGGNQPNLNQTIIRNLRPPLPQLDIQKHYVSYVRSFEEEISLMHIAQERDGGLLDELEQSILAQAFQGEA